MNCSSCGNGNQDRIERWEHAVIDGLLCGARCLECGAVVQWFDAIFTVPPGVKISDIPYAQPGAPRRACVAAATCDCGASAVARVWFSRGWEFLCQACLDRYLPTRRDAEVQTLGGCSALDAFWNRCDGSYSRPKRPERPPGTHVECECGLPTEFERGEVIGRSLLGRVKSTGVSRACPLHGLRIELGDGEAFDVIPINPSGSQAGWRDATGSGFVYPWHDKSKAVIELLVKAWESGERNTTWLVTEHGIEEMPEGW